MQHNKNYKISLSELFQFNVNSRMKILKNKGVLILERKISRNIIVKIYSFFGTILQVFESVTKPKQYQMQPVYNLECLDAYISDIDLKKLGL